MGVKDLISSFQQKSSAASVPAGPPQLSTRGKSAKRVVTSAPPPGAGGTGAFPSPTSPPAFPFPATDAHHLPPSPTTRPVAPSLADKKVLFESLQSPVHVSKPSTAGSKSDSKRTGPGVRPLQQGNTAGTGGGGGGGYVERGRDGTKPLVAAPAPLSGPVQSHHPATIIDNPAPISMQATLHVHGQEQAHEPHVHPAAPVPPASHSPPAPGSPSSPFSTSTTAHPPTLDLTVLHRGLTAMVAQGGVAGGMKVVKRGGVYGVLQGERVEGEMEAGEQVMGETAEEGGGEKEEERGAIAAGDGSGGVRETHGDPTTSRPHPHPPPTPPPTNLLLPKLDGKFDRARGPARRERWRGIKGSPPPLGTETAEDRDAGTAAAKHAPSGRGVDDGSGDGGPTTELGSSGAGAREIEQAVVVADTDTDTTGGEGRSGAGTWEGEEGQDESTQRRHERGRVGADHGAVESPETGEAG
ncbi:hypothetical protein HDU93_009513 [Gonapodya sp. JEL0774]|nr:hypothetical protein HDU93_009513 [Gonapodya sp. JEL0774]